MANSQSNIINANFAYLNDRIKDIELFKFPNATIVGTPTIQSGQVSNFSEANYMIFPFELDVRNQGFEVDFCFTTASDVTTQQNILDSEFGLALAIQNGRGIMALSSNGTSWDIGLVTGTKVILPNTVYYARLSWNKLAYKTFLDTKPITDSTTYDMYKVDTRGPYPRPIYIGGSYGLFGPGTAHPFKGSINMNKCYVRIAGALIWQGMDDAGLATRANVSLDNLDAVGQAKFDAKQNKLSDTQMNSVDSGITSSKVSAYDNHIANGTIHVTASDKIAWSNKVNQNQLSGYGSELDYADETLSLLNTSGDVLSSVKIKSTPDLDNKSINLNSSEQLQAIGIIDSNGSIMKTWRGTLAEYNALATKDDNTLYKITDDTDTGTDILQMIYPVGSIYETSNPTCPLANLFGTWVQEPNIVNDKFVIETYINGANGYRIWNDGYCDQWGEVVLDTTGNGTAEFLKKYINTNYNFLNDNGRRIEAASWIVYPTAGRTVDTQPVKSGLTGYTLYSRWKASGFLASDQYTHINIPTYNKFRRIA